MDKKLLFRFELSVLFLSLFFNASATIQVVQVASFQFTPNTMSVNVGDTVRFTWLDGSHTTTSVTIPNVAAPWDSPMNSSITQFDYKVTVAGSYSYKCTPHAGMGMVGAFNASDVTGIPSINGETSITTIFPNPFNNELIIEQGNEFPEYSQFIICDILGKQLKTFYFENISPLSGKRKIDVAELPKGVYLVTLKGNGTK